MKDCTKEPCCNTCKHSRLGYTVKRHCVVDTNPYQNYFGGHFPDDVCDKFEPVDWFIEKQKKMKEENP